MPFFYVIIIIGDSMKRGFTLVELLAVLILLGVVSLIAIPSIGKILNRSREKARESTKNNIRELPDDGSHKCLSVSEIEESGYISNDDIVDPTTEEKLTGYVKIYFDNTYNQYTYEYVKSCE